MPTNLNRLKILIICSIVSFVCLAEIFIWWGSALMWWSLSFLPIFLLGGWVNYIILALALKNTTDMTNQQSQDEIRRFLRLDPKPETE